MNSRARRILVPKDGVAGQVSLGFSEERWETIRTKLPAKLSHEDSDRLRNRVNGCCNHFLTTAKLIQKGALAASSVKKGGGKQAAPLDQLERHLRSAAKILGTVEDMLDDRPGLLRRYRDQLETIAADVLARKEALRNLRPVVVNPKHDLVRSLAKICESCGLKVTATNRIYDERTNRPSWFQEFVGAVNDALLGAQGWGAAGGSRKALHADVLKALRGR